MRHSIRLHGPWEYRVAGADFDPQAAPRWLPFPVPISALPFDPLPGRIELIRRFGRPAGLATCTRVRLAWTNGALPAVARLDGDESGDRTARPGELVVWDLAHPLPWRNQIMLSIDLSRLDDPAAEEREERSGKDDPALIGECVVQIEEPPGEAAS